MIIDKLIIKNFKSFKDKFVLDFNSGINIIVGNNEAGKSTILEAINIILTGCYNGRYLNNELSEYLFNKQIVEEYITSLSSSEKLLPPEITLELYLKAGSEEDSISFLEGDGNSEKNSNYGLVLKVQFDDNYKQEYQSFINQNDVKTLPIEYYKVVWRSFARDNITARSIPLKCAFIDSSATRYQNGSDIYINRIIKELLSTEEIVSISQAHRQMKEVFMRAESVKKINNKINEASKVSDKTVNVSVELSSKNAWESTLMTYLDKIPFSFIGKGEQSIVKINLALAHKKAQEANLILIEEPENHLSHTKLNSTIENIKNNCANKQIVITTHSSFVANKLGLSDLILLSDKNTIKLSDLTPDTKAFYEKIAGYDTLRFILCDKAILVEGDSDELIVQKAYYVKYNKLPIEDGIEVISVGTSSLRFLEIAEELKKKTSVVVDTDGDLQALNEKFNNYLGKNKKEYITICFDKNIDQGDLVIREKPFNYNTLEPKLLSCNSLALFNEIFETNFDLIDMYKYMKNNKTDCALKLFQTNKVINFPKYILDAI